MVRNNIKGKSPTKILYSKNANYTYYGAGNDGTSITQSAEYTAEQDCWVSIVGIKYASLSPNKLSQSIKVDNITASNTNLDEYTSNSSNWSNSSGMGYKITSFKLKKNSTLNVSQSTSHNNVWGYLTLDVVCYI